MVYDDQLLPTEAWISLPFEWAFLLFHVVITLFIGLQLIRGTRAFASAFFLFFFLLSLADIGNYWTVRIRRIPLLRSTSEIQIQYMQRIARYGLLGEWRPSSFGCTLTLFFTGFFSYLQFATHLTIAANRYTVFLQPAMHRRVRPISFKNINMSSADMAWQVSCVGSDSDFRDLIRLRKRSLRPRDDVERDGLRVYLRHEEYERQERNT